jgi:hypothetical protein
MLHACELLLSCSESSLKLTDAILLEEVGSVKLLKLLALLLNQKSSVSELRSQLLNPHDIGKRRELDSSSNGHDLIGGGRSRKLDCGGCNGHDLNGGGRSRELDHDLIGGGGRSRELDCGILPTLCRCGSRVGGDDDHIGGCGRSGKLNWGSQCGFCSCGLGRCSVARLASGQFLYEINGDNKI